MFRHFSLFLPCPEIECDRLFKRGGEEEKGEEDVKRMGTIERRRETQKGKDKSRVAAAAAD